MRPLIGISCCVKAFGANAMPNHAASDHYIRVVLGPVGGMPVLIPAAGEDLARELLPRLDGILLTGSRSNVQPSLYQGPPHLEGTPEDAQRDSTTLPLIRAALEEGVPLLAICRGFQELNVALGGTLDQRIQDLPGRMDHSTPIDQVLPRVRTGKAHAVRVTEDGALARLWSGLDWDAAAVPVNSLHNQGVAKPAPRLLPEGWAPDGTVEAARVRGARDFALGVQWHPEYDWQSDALSRRLFEVFGAAAGNRAARRAASAQNGHSLTAVAAE
ncbi:gamma-glutamyl-gamma-aminobutyrate hydrolase family protein [Roseomonas marmotae]|uniref:Gamma-glutamyl-gamma-aminobutyrate hydrolase family protein n=1 Tax=Roseomonas marmotae TaxID=2768161 RepID=A0ABS3K6C9_9PROT|nr:gamma-glutamyl-gamma-aminobutyrate hydrolase family protein [Roseomonas marmotae]MBO1073005.1 gamma-glutamyl-gamma-aminobutyrate hydrolase family protein [Roseomonas marmotae]QTI79347.1 gamma-glutamyl-gamma-aminobutyrate hydrolase family protein [Roseomonas marmotae]